MRLTRRALLGLAGLAGLAGCVSSDDHSTASPAGSGLPGTGLPGDGLYHDPATLEEATDECFIATAAEGSIDHEHVVQLRSFRDRTLCSSTAGRLFIRAYYATSPPVADWIARSDRRRAIARTVLVRPLSRAVTAAGLTDNEQSIHE